MTDDGSRDANTDNSKTCGYNNCALGDKLQWQKSISIFQSLLSKLDFVSFQEMLGQFSRDPQNPGTWDNPNPKAYSDDEIGIDSLGVRVDNFAKFLKERLHKPVFVPYFTVATATWSDKDDDGTVDSDEINTTGYEAEASKAYGDVVTIETTNKNIFGFLPMALFDDPVHDKGGYQYFLQDEYHLGIVKAPLKDDQLTGDIHFKSDVIENIFH